MISFLTQLKLDEILSVDKAANPDARILLMKRDGAVMSPDEALRESIASGLADDDIADKGAWINQQLDAYRDHVGKRVVTFKKGAEMSISDETLIAISKGVVERNAPAVFSKAVFIAAIARRADEIKKAGELTAQSFTRTITQDEVGKLLYRASKSASGPELEPDGQSDYPASTTNAPPWVGLGPAHARMQVLADDHQKANPRKSAAGAFGTVYADPKNAVLREQCKAEHLAAISKAA